MNNQQNPKWRGAASLRIAKTTLCIAAAYLGFGANAAHAQTDEEENTTVVTAPAGSTTTIKKTGNGDIVVTVNGAPAAFAPMSLPRMLEGRVMVPLRGVIEKLGGSILYDAKSKVVTGAHERSGNQFRMRVGSDEALLNGQNMPLDAPPRVLNGVTYVPLRFVSQAMGAAVKWDAARRTVIIEGEQGEAKVKTKVDTAPPNDL